MTIELTFGECVLLFAECVLLFGKCVLLFGECVLLCCTCAPQPCLAVVIFKSQLDAYFTPQIERQADILECLLMRCTGVPCATTLNSSDSQSFDSLHKNSRQRTQ